jgi:hypothetical protein
VCPAVGDKITVRARHVETWVVTTRMERMARARPFDQPVAMRGRWFHSWHEGITWIRGEHANDSLEVAALLAANTLCRPR